MRPRILASLCTCGADANLRTSKKENNEDIPNYLVPNSLVLRPLIQYPVRLPCRQRSCNSRRCPGRPRLLALLSRVMRWKGRVCLGLASSLLRHHSGAFGWSPGRGTDGVCHLRVYR